MSERNKPYKAIWQYYWQARTRYQVHSPVIFDFLQHVYEAINPQGALRFEEQRSMMLRDERSIPYVEYGAGSQRIVNSHDRLISDIARSSLSGRVQCAQLHHLVKRYQPGTIVELGTSLGLSAAYMASASSRATLYSLEGNPASLAYAQAWWTQARIDNIRGIEGRFRDTLPRLLSDLDTVDMAFIDGHHLEAPTVEYYKLLSSRMHEDSVCIIDDIYWSQGMHRAWQSIKAYPEVAYSIDVFSMGILFFKGGLMPKRHFRLIPYHYKPWAVGLTAKSD